MARDLKLLLETYEIIQADYVKWEKKTIHGTKIAYTRAQIVCILAQRHRYKERTIEDILLKDLVAMRKELEEPVDANQLNFDFK